MSYLVGLTQRLGAGLEQLTESERDLQSRFFWSQQRPDGGFCGRTEASDLYYTAFALRGLAVLGDEDRSRAELAAGYLRQQMLGRASVIDLISLVLAGRLLETWMAETVFGDGDWPHSVVAVLEQLRRPDGGYAKSADGHASSTYQTFLTAIAYELLELPLPEAERAANFLLGQQREDGGFVEIGVMRRSGTNPTAAAIGGLRILEPSRITSQLQSRTADYLVGNFTDEGGLRANTQIPIADLLSTYTGLQTLQDVGAGGCVDPQAVLGYLRTLQQPTGGFSAACWDNAVDVEYSFYGIASLGLLNGWESLEAKNG
ncbi:MAG: terpene cyclase/mutase family protein [Pirellulales bacterium]|nr:terpene cyclase/mutase family protein [Pirellulales bacterium]